MRRLAALLAFAPLAVGCLTRDVSAEQPSTKISFDTRLPHPAIDKVDLLVVVDNSSSMADKQKILADAVPDLLHGLTSPKCVDPISRAPIGDGTQRAPCPEGSEPAFAPVTDMHIGVVSSSLGGCAPAPGRIDDDHAHLLARAPDGGVVAAAGDLHFLAWYPPVPTNADKRRHPEPPVPKTTTLDALETGLRDLVVGVGDNGCGIEHQLESAYRFLVDTKVNDATLLQQRGAFLRPDSLVAIVMLTDEDDASVDPASFHGTGARFEESPPMPRATAACASDPNAPTCTSCAFAPDDSACRANGGLYAPQDDDLNVRFHQMKARYGVDPRFPIDRYVKGFGEGLATPERTADLVYFAVIGGVPPALVDKDDVDWTPILGRAPESFDTTGIDPHMIDSTTPRPGLPSPTSGDPNREWTTHGKDLELACAFDLPAPRTCDATKEACDCDGTRDIPLCKSDDPKVQIRAKAYPTLRELEVAKALGPHGIPASLCPIQLTAPDRDDYGYRPAMRAILRRFEEPLAECLPRALETIDGKGDVPCLVVARLRDEGSDSDCASVGLAPPSPDLLRQIRERVTQEEGPAEARHPICNIPQVSVAPGQTCRQDTSQIGFCYAVGAPGVPCAHSLQFTKPAADLGGARFSLQCIQLTSSN